MFDTLHTLSLFLGLNREIFWITLVAGVLTAGFTASIVNLSIWKGMLIAFVALSVAGIAMPLMHPLWQQVAQQGGVAGLQAGTSEHFTWIGVGAMAALAAAFIGGRLNTSVAEALWVVCMAASSMWGAYAVMTYA